MGVCVAVGIGVYIAVGSAVDVAVEVGACVGSGVSVVVAVGVGVGSGVAVAIVVGESVGVKVGSGMRVAVCVNEGVGSVVCVAVGVGKEVGVGMGVGTGTGVGETSLQAPSRTNDMQPATRTANPGNKLLLDRSILTYYRRTSTRFRDAIGSNSYPTTTSEIDPEFTVTSAPLTPCSNKPNSPAK